MYEHNSFYISSLSETPVVRQGEIAFRRSAAEELGEGLYVFYVYTYVGLYIYIYIYTYMYI